MLTPAFGGGGDAGASRSAACLRNTRVNSLFLVSHFIQEFNPYLDFKRFVSILMVGDSATLWDKRFLRNCDTAVYMLKKRW